MNETKFGTILENAARLAGRDPALIAIPPGWKVLAGMALEAGLHSLAAEKFPIMQRVELRRYRPDWNGTSAYQIGQEVWFEGEYRKWTDSGWKILDMSEVAAFIAFDQPWEPTAMQSFGVDTTRFAYAADPRYNPEAPALPCKLGELGVIVMGHGGALPPKEVFVKFIPEYPRFDFNDWVENGSYSPGDTVYKAKDVWQYLGDEGGGGTTAPDQDTSGVWRPLRVRSEFAAYLTRLVAADLLTEDQGKYQTKAAADREFELICERYHEGNGETRVRVGRFRR